MFNRLKLDFSLDTADKRATFINDYVNNADFQAHPLTDDELELMGNYILWGRDPETGKNACQDKTIRIPTKHKTWDHEPDIASLDELMEQPTFNEATLVAHNPPARIKQAPFSRKQVRTLLAATPNPTLEYAFNMLYTQIDELNFQLAYYDLIHGKKSEIKESIINAVAPERLNTLQEQTTHWSAFKYLKLRHYLVDLRRQQFTLRDSLTNQITLHTDTPHILENETLNFGEDVLVKPLGVRQPASALLFQDLESLNPYRFTEQELAQISHIYWHEHDKIAGRRRVIDFTNNDDVYKLLLTEIEYRADINPDELEGNLAELFDTLDFYIKFADLTDIQREILELKQQMVRNQDIAFQINRKYGKSYTDNYISTIFTQKIVPAIADAAHRHALIIENLFFEENFKTCSRCGRTLLKDGYYFVHKGRSKDGFNSQCKMCEKLMRQERRSI